MFRSLFIDSSKKLILWLLIALVIVFSAGMWILSTLNLNYSEAAIVEVRQKQIEETFFNNLNKITQTQQTLEHYTADLARLANVFADLYAADDTPENINRQLQAVLQNKLEDFDGTSALGVWFDPKKLTQQGQAISHVAFQSKTGKTRLLDSASGKLPSIEQQSWYQLTEISRTSESQIQSQSEAIYWTPAYFNDLTDTAVLSLVKPIIDSSQQVVGYVSTDWQAQQVIDLVSQVSITPNTFALLIDKNKRKLSSLSRLNNEQFAQKIIDSVMQQDFIALSDKKDFSQLQSPQQKAMLQTHQFAVDGEEYVLYAASTPAQMLFAVGVPKNEIDAVIAPMRAINQQILLLTGLVMLLLSGYLVYRIVLLMQELQASYTDQLTELPNRARLLLDLEPQNKNVLILINIDRFRELNSIFGNDCGDAVLKRLCQSIIQFCHDYNHVDPARLYRLSGDEFVLLGQRWSKEFLFGFLRQLSDFLQDQHFQWQDQDISLTASIGAADQLDTESASSPDILISHATSALKMAREQSRNYAIYSRGQDVERVYEQNLFWARQLKQALQQDRIMPWFQPIVDNQTGRISKYECLIRMVDAEGKVISPGVFLPVASKLRLDSFLTRVMVEKSFQKFAKLPYEFSINLSYRDLLDTELTQFIFEKLAVYQVGDRLIFEILESDGIENYHEVRLFIDKAKSFGCKIAIDDFGSGYSNFEHVLRLNVDLIKIDGSLIKYLDEDPSAVVVTRGVVHFAQSLGIKTAAEFVHSEAVQNQVKELGIDFSQGAYFSMPQAELMEN